MTNALKFILKVNNLTQAEFADQIGIHRQNVTRWVKRQKPIHGDYIRYIEDNFNIPKRFFVDENSRYVKILDDNEKLELEDYLLRKKFELPISTTSRYNYYKNRSKLSETERVQREQRDANYSIAYRRKKANVDIQAIVKAIKSDINDVPETTEKQSGLSRLDMLESNINLYQKFIHLRESKKITDDEWDIIFNALFMLASEEKDICSNNSTTQIYKFLKSNR